MPRIFKLAALVTAVGSAAGFGVLTTGSALARTAATGPASPTAYHEMQNWDGQGAFCLDANINPNGLYDGDKVQLWGCNGRSNQQWRFNGSELQNMDTANGTFCLDANSNDIESGDNVQVWSCNGHANQQWSLKVNTGSPSNYWALSNGANAALCLDANSNDIENGDNIQLWGCNNRSNQAWTVP